MIGNNLNIDQTNTKDHGNFNVENPFNEKVKNQAPDNKSSLYR
jgi:hypothetical protein